MTDVINVLSPLVTVQDANGDPVANGSIEFYVAGTSTPKTVYANRDLTTALGTTVATDSAGYPITGGSARTLIYTGVGDFKMIVKNSLGATLVTHDNVPGAVATVVTSEFALPETPVISKTSNYTVTTADQGKIINCNPTGGSFAITLLSAVTAGDGFRVTVRHSANSTNVVTIRTTGGEVIGIPGKGTTAFALKGWGAATSLVSDGASWIVDSEVQPAVLDGIPYLKITDRLTTPPATPVGGARYIINGSPTGAWSTLGFAANQIAESDGNGSWFSYTPASGWFCYVADEDLFTKFDGTQWEDQTGMGAPSSSTLQAAVFEHSLANGTVGGTATTAAWTTRTLNNSASNTITGCSLASNQITLPVGTYLVSFHQSLIQASAAQSRLKVISGTATPDPILAGVFTGYALDSGSQTPGTLEGQYGTTAILTVTATAVIELQYWVNTSAGGTSGLGAVSAEPTGSNEIYARVAILSLAALQGPPGPTGAQGVAAPRQNALINGAMTVAQQGTSFTSGTTPANSDGNYTLDGWVLLSDGNNIVNVAQSTDAPTGSLNSLSMTVATVNKKFGIFQPVERRDALGCIGATCTVSFKMKASSVTNLDNVRVAIVAWSSTADSITRDIVSSWNVEGTNPTLAANWTYENTPTTITPTTSWATYSVSAAIDTASCKNIGVFIWSDVTVTTLTTDVLYITEVQLEPQTSASTYLYQPQQVEVARCQRLYQRYGGVNSFDFQFRGYGAAAAQWVTTLLFPTEMRIAPTATLVNSGSWSLTNCSSPICDAISTKHARFGVTITALGTWQIFTWDATTYLQFDARL